MKRYMVAFIDGLEFKASNSSTTIIEALEIIKGMQQKGYRKLPANAPIDFIKKRWLNLVFKEDGNIDRHFYEFAVLSELKNALRSGDIWVIGSRQYKDFEEYLLDADTFHKFKASSSLPIRGYAGKGRISYTKEFNLSVISFLSGL